MTVRETMTRHAILRSAQRGISLADVDIINLIGTEVENGYFVREKDCQEFEHGLKTLADHARRLIGKRLVVSDGKIVTAYHARRAKERSLLRRAQDRSLTR